MTFLQQLKRILPSRRQTVPIFPLNAVLFPGGVLPLKVFEQRYIDMVKYCLKDNSVFGICLIREDQNAGAKAVPEPVGCIARILDWNMEQPELLQLRVQGESRFRIVDSGAGNNGVIAASVETLSADTAMAIPASLAGCADLVRKVVASVGAASFAEPYLFEDASWVGNRLAEFLPIKIAAKQKLMELSDPIARLEILAQFLAQQGLL